MYEDLDCFEKALSHFGTRVDMICAMEMGGKIDAETAYQNIKMEFVRDTKRRTVMTADSLKTTQNEDGSFTMDWDPQDPKWSWMNGLTQKEIQVIMEQAIKDFLDDR